VIRLDFTCPNKVLFECSKCGLCCCDTTEKARCVLLLESEAKEISARTCLPKEAFTKSVENKHPYGFEMKKNEGKCFFLKDNQCSIYSSRPLICRFYPFELKFDFKNRVYVFSFTYECPSIGKGKVVTRADFEGLFLLAQGRLL
jgi:Fe-S-cluster containining protein